MYEVRAWNISMGSSISRYFRVMFLSFDGLQPQIS